VSPRELWARQKRVQRSLVFKIAASAVILLLAIAATASYVVAVTAPEDESPLVGGERPAETATSEEDGETPDVSPVPSPTEARSALDAALGTLSRIRTAREDPVNVGLGIAAVAGVALVITWLGLLLTYIELIALAALIAWPLSLIRATSELATLLVGCAALTASFTALMEGLRVLYAWLPGSVFAIARNVLIEAVRMKISLVFIVLLILGMAALPNLLSDSTQLRYRVQSFLQYGTSGSFWIIALLTVLFSVATVTFEQRDKQIWQTMTKPVAAWQYLLGKWIGLVSIAAVLLAVSATGIFTFTEYLRSQPAYGEEEALAADSPVPSKDREILETQVLVARKSVSPDLPPELSGDSEQFRQMVEGYIENERTRDPDFAKDPQTLHRLRDDLFQQLLSQYRTIEPGNSQQFLFSGLQGAAEFNSPIFLRYRVDAGANRPDMTYRLTFALSGLSPLVNETSLGNAHSIALSPVVVIPVESAALPYTTVTMDDPDFHRALAAGLPMGTRLVTAREIIAEDGTVVLEVMNGDWFRRQANPDSISFPADGLELTYAVGSYRANFLRVVLVLWIKLCFLAMLGLATGTFLSFPVATLVAVGTFLAAESAGFLTTSLEYYGTVDREGNPIWIKVLIHAIASGVAWMFGVYADLKPTTRLVDGRLLPWGDVGVALAVLASWCVVLYGVGVAIFRRRELAIYSGA